MSASLPALVPAARRDYAAKYAVEFFERKKVPSYALWSVTLKDPESGHYAKIPAGYGRTDTLEQARLDLTAWCEDRGLSFDRLRQDMPQWRLVKDLLEGKNGAEFFARAIKRTEAPNVVLDIRQPTTDLVHILDGRVYTDSRKVAEKFKKAHGRVLRAIDNLPHDDFWKTNFGFRDYVTERGKTERYFEIAWKGFSILAMGFTGKEAYEWKRDFLDAFEMMGDYIVRRKEDFKDPPRAGVLTAKRAAHNPMQDALIEARADDGKDTEAKHFITENRLCNWAVMGEFAKIDEKTLSNEDAALLERVRDRNRSYIHAGLDYTTRKPKLREFATRQRTKALAAP
jgi:Rha family phage regulatory protein